jgi:hypothetical protein
VERAARGLEVGGNLVLQSGVGGELVQRGGDPDRGRLVAGEEEQEGLFADLVVAERVTGRVASLEKQAHQVVARPPLTGGDQLVGHGERPVERAAGPDVRGGREPDGGCSGLLARWMICTEATPMPWCSASNAAKSSVPKTLRPTARRASPGGDRSIDPGAAATTSAAVLPPPPARPATG